MSSTPDTSPIGDTPSERVEQLMRAVERVFAWLHSNCAGDIPRAQIAKLVTICDLHTEALTPPPAAQAEPTNALVTMIISVARDGSLQSDVRTHNNSYADVSRGLAAVKREIERVFDEQKNCPHYPVNAEAAKTPIVRTTPKPPEETFRRLHLSASINSIDLRISTSKGGTIQEFKPGISAMDFALQLCNMATQLMRDIEMRAK